MKGIKGKGILFIFKKEGKIQLQPTDTTEPRASS